MLNPSSIKKNHLEDILKNNDPIIATSDYVRSFAQMISSYVKNKFVPMGTDGFGRSDTRANLRDFFEIDYKHIVIESLFSLFEEGKISLEKLEVALKTYQFQSNLDHPWKR